MKKLFLTGMISLTAISCSRDEAVKDSHDNHDTHHAHWDYENPDWAKQGYSECAGLVQSPINIETTKTVKTDLPAIQFNYKDFPISIIDNGHTVQVNAKENSITYNGDVYDLKQFHFHGHSEHYVDGKSLPMEVHFVHKSPKTGALVVLGVFVEGGGAENEDFNKYLKAFPTEKNKEVSKAETINPENMFPNQKGYYNYTGSLTTPPCSQGLNWIVLKEVVKVSDKQLDAFVKRYGHNARPIQKTGSRTVFESK